MNLYLIHCGFYDDEISDAIYEFHVNIPIAAVDIDSAKASVRLDPLFKKKKMHIDGIQEIRMVDGFEVVLQNRHAAAKTEINNIPFRDL